MSEPEPELRDIYELASPKSLLAFYNGLTQPEMDEHPFDFASKAHPGQIAPDCGWRTWLIMAGRGFGKTRAGAEWVRRTAEADPAARIALVAASLGEARSVMVEGQSGLLAIGPPERRPSFEPSLRRVRYPNGALATIYSAAEPESLRGPEHSHAWCDELAKWTNAHGRAERAWDNLQMGLRLGEAQQVLVTTTPRAVPLLQRLLAQEGEEDFYLTGGATEANRKHLPKAFITAMRRQFGDTALGRQELDGEMLAEVEGALWSRALLERCRIPPRYGEGDHPQDGGGAPSANPAIEGSGADTVPLHPSLRERSPSPAGGGITRVVIGVDPPASSNGDACGIVVAAQLEDGSAAVLADCSVEKPSPERWARAVANAAAVWRADRVVAEANQGGAMVASVLRAADISLPVKLVHAARGKSARAEPVAALYEAGRVKHAGLFAQLEDELCGLMAGGGYEGPGRSPDRADALVWALSELMLGRRGRPRIRNV